MLVYNKPAFFDFYQQILPLIEDAIDATLVTPGRFAVSGLVSTGNSVLVKVSVLLFKFRLTDGHGFIEQFRKYT